MEEFCDSLTKNTMVVCLYFAVLLVLVLMIFWSTRETSEGLIGTGLGHGDAKTKLSDYSSEAAALTSGAKARRLAQEFSQPIQGNYDTTHKHDALSVLQRVKPEESLVSTRGEPDFWQIGNVLAAYRRRGFQGSAQSASEQAIKEAQAMKGTEFYTDGSQSSIPAQAVDNLELQSHLYK